MPPVLFSQMHSNHWSTSHRGWLFVLTIYPKKEHAQLSTYLQKITYSDVDIKTVVDFYNKIHNNLDSATFEGKRHILELLDVRGTLALENDEKVIYVSCLISPQPVSLVLTSPLSSIGGTGIPSYVYRPTGLYR